MSGIGSNALSPDRPTQRTENQADDKLREGQEGKIRFLDPANNQQDYKRIHGQLSNDPQVQKMIKDSGNKLTVDSFVKNAETQFFVMGDKLGHFNNGTKGFYDKTDTFREGIYDGKSGPARSLTDTKNKNYNANDITDLYAAMHQEKIFDKKTKELASSGKAHYQDGAQAYQQFGAQAKQILALKNKYASTGDGKRSRGDSSDAQTNVNKVWQDLVDTSGLKTLDQLDKKLNGFAANIAKQEKNQQAEDKKKPADDIASNKGKPEIKQGKIEKVNNESDLRKAFANMSNRIDGEGPDIIFVGKGGAGDKDYQQVSTDADIKKWLDNFAKNHGISVLFYQDKQGTAKTRAALEKLGIKLAPPNDPYSRNETEFLKKTADGSYKGSGPGLRSIKSQLKLNHITSSDFPGSDPLQFSRGYGLNYNPG